LTRVLVDSSCLVAATLPFHEHHAATLADLARRRAAGQTFVLAAHSILEGYAVLTRLPPPHRLAAPDAFAVLERNWGKADIVSLGGIDSWRLLRHVVESGVTGGRVYDAAIAACARKGKAVELLTWNVKHFAGVQGVRVMSPLG